MHSKMRSLHPLSAPVRGPCSESLCAPEHKTPLGHRKSTKTCTTAPFCDSECMPLLFSKIHLLGKARPSMACLAPSSHAARLTKDLQARASCGKHLRFASPGVPAPAIKRRGLVFLRQATQNISERTRRHQTSVHRCLDIRNQSTRFGMQ